MSLAEFGTRLSAAFYAANVLPVEEHARLAYRAGGPSITELQEKSRAHRGALLVTA